jgi:hypothetical protein
MDVRLVRVSSKLTGVPFDDDSRPLDLFRLLCLVYIAPLNAAPQRRCKCER